jgi:hypothetical protein
MSSRAEKIIAAGAALVVGSVVGLSHSWAWGMGISFAIYVVMMLDYILDRLDDLKTKIDPHN